MKQSRRESRETAFALLFEWSFQPDESMDELIKQAESYRDAPVDAFCRSLCDKTVANAQSLDTLIETYSDRWKLSRISKVNLAVLRLAFCEMSQFTDIPVGATINEAVELVKTYGTEDEAAYVNGILGSYDRSRSKAK